MSIKRKPLNRETIKYIAILTMLLSHIAGVFLQQGTLLYEIMTDIGYFTAVSMCYFLVEGYYLTSSKRNYGLRLFIFAIISQPPYMLLFKDGESELNMIYTLFICFLILVAREKIKNKLLCVIIELGLTLATLKADWFIFAPVFVIMCDTWKTKSHRGKSFSPTHRACVSSADALHLDDHMHKKKLWYAYIILGTVFGILMFMSYIDIKPIPIALLCASGSCAGIMSSGIVIQFFYNEKQAKHGRIFSKWFFYLFYPAHLLILFLIKNNL